MKYSDIEKTTGNAEEAAKAVRRQLFTLRLEEWTDRVIALAVALTVGCAAILGCSFAITLTVRIWTKLFCG